MDDDVVIAHIENVGDVTEDGNVIKARIIKDNEIGAVFIVVIEVTYLKEENTMETLKDNTKERNNTLQRVKMLDSIVMFSSLVTD